MKIIDGFFMVDDLLVLFCWSDFLIRFKLLYVKFGDRFFICLLFCGKNVVYIRECSVIVIIIDGKKLLKYLCILSNLRGLLFDFEDNIVVCFEDGWLE